jgi:tetrahydromethanopterin S-methyltransferase subunit G
VNLIERIDELERKVENVGQGLDAVKRVTENVEGKPIVRATQGSRFYLNDHLDVLLLNKRISKVEKIAEAAASESGKGLKIEAGRNIEFEKNEKTKATIINADTDKWSSIPIIIP